ncbi:hypothetical protein [Novosphingobium sp.]|uniref:hypothetical protein n=1 Tax=Novosphingobium sp. TaxID=1874826 RepID=UPI002FE0C201
MTAMFFAIAGFSIRSVIAGIILVVSTAMFWLIETRLQRPRRSFYRLALGSALLLIFFLYVSWHGERLLAGVTWLGVTAIALFMTVHYERSEGLN